MTPPTDGTRDRDAAGRARNARARDELGRPLMRSDGDAVPVDEPALAPAEALQRAQTLLDDGRPFTAHEVLEAVWKDTPDPTRELWRGLAQVAVGITPALRRNESGARSLLLRGATTLAQFEGSTPYGVDVDGVREWAQRASEDPALAAVPPRLTR